MAFFRSGVSFHRGRGSRHAGIGPGEDGEDPRLQRGIAWLKSNQRESGKWFTRSPMVATRNLITNTGSAFAILALQACGELPGWPFEEAE